MKIINTREFRNETKKFFELAEKEHVIVKRGDKYVSLVVTEEPEKTVIDEEWVREFMAIPEKYRCNPFEISPSGDLYWADKRNVEALERAEADVREGKVTRLTEAKRKELFGL